MAARSPSAARALALALLVGPTVACVSTTSEIETQRFPGRVVTGEPSAGAPSLRARVRPLGDGRALLRVEALAMCASREERVVEVTKVDKTKVSTLSWLGIGLYGVTGAVSVGAGASSKSDGGGSASTGVGVGELAVAAIIYAVANANTGESRSVVHRSMESVEHAPAPCAAHPAAGSAVVLRIGAHAFLGTTDAEGTLTVGPVAPDTVTLTVGETPVADVEWEQ